MPNAALRHDPTPTSEQIRLMLESQPKRMTLAEWERLDAVMASQREKHGLNATAWWFDAARAHWKRIAQRHGRGGSVGR